jgi:hypothetical protein
MNQLNFDQFRTKSRPGQQVCGNCTHYAACSVLYHVGADTKRCQLEPSKFKSKERKQEEKRGKDTDQIIVDDSVA